MPSKPDTSFAYRASQFVLNNHNLIYCHCAKPYPEFVKTGALKGVQYCEVCNGILTKETLDDLAELARRR